MSNPSQQPSSQAPQPVPMYYSSQLPAHLIQYPFGQSTYVSSPPISSLPPTQRYPPQSCPPQNCPRQAPQSQAPEMYNFGNAPQYMPPTNPNVLQHQGTVLDTPVVPPNHQMSGQGRTVRPAPRPVANNMNRNTSSGPQTPHNVANNNIPTEYLSTDSSPAGRQTPGHMFNGGNPIQYATTNAARPQTPQAPQTTRPVSSSNSHDQYVPTSVPAGTPSGYVNSAAQPISRQTQQTPQPPQGNMAPVSSAPQSMPPQMQQTPQRSQQPTPPRGNMPPQGNMAPGAQPTPPPGNIAPRGNMPAQGRMAPGAQPTPHRGGNVAPGARRAGQDSTNNGQQVSANYDQIINGQLMPAAVRANGQQAPGPSHQTQRQPMSNSGRNGQVMRAANAVYLSPHQTKPVPQPTATRYDLPSNAHMAPQPGHGRVATPPVTGNGYVPQSRSVPPRSSALPRSSVPPPISVHARGSLTPGNSMPPPSSVPARSTALHSTAAQPAMSTAVKRAADQPLRQQPTKRQRKPAVASTVQQPPVAPVQQPAPVSAPQQPPPTTSNTDPVTRGHLAPLPPSFADEPMHLPDYELAKINTSLVIEPDVAKPRPKGKEALAWEQVIDMIVELIQQHCRKGHLLRMTQLMRLRELSDTMEEFIGRAGRRLLLPREAEDLLNVRYVRVIEDGIWDGQFAAIPHRDHDTYVATAPEDKEKVVREAWEKRAAEYQGPSLEEAQRQIFKWDRIPGFANVPENQEEEEDDGDAPRPARVHTPKPWYLQGL